MMTLEGLTAVLHENPGALLQLQLPDGSMIPAHFHVTEVGRVQKDFIDCGGTIRNSTSCVLQLWVANDLAHRLDTTKVSSIIQKGMKLFETTEIPLEVEYDNGLISQYPIVEASTGKSAVILQLASKHTACLAPDRCGVQLDVLSPCSAPGCC